MMYFGTDGIRGKAYDTLPLLRAYQLGVALKEVYPKDQFIIGYDTRVSSLDFVHALVDGLEGMKVKVAGMVPTPLIAYDSQVNHLIGVMITASHNPYEDNGLKVFEYGFKVSDDAKQNLETVMQTVTSYSKRDVLLNTVDKTQDYVTFATSLFGHPTFNDYVIDCAHGTTSFISQMMFEVPHYFNEPNGTNINEACGATYMQAVQEVKKNHRVGFSFDGDGDRMLMVIDEDIIYGDQILYLFAKDMMLKGDNVSVALSVMTNPGVFKAFKHLGVDVYETPVGDAYLFEAIKDGHATIGAEASGHYMLHYDNGMNRVLIGDGMLAAKKVIDIISRYSLDVIKTWLKDIEMVPMSTKSIHIDKAVLNKPHISTCIESIQKEVSKPYKCIVRPSGTEEKIRLAVSLPTQKEVDDMLHRLVACLERG